VFGLCSRLRLYIVLLFAELRTQVIFRFVAARGPETLINENGRWLQTKTSLRAPFLSNEAQKHIE